MGLGLCFGFLEERGHDGRTLQGEDPVAKSRQRDGVVPEAGRGIDHEGSFLAHRSVERLLRRTGATLHSSREVDAPHTLGPPGARPEFHPLERGNEMKPLSRRGVGFDQGQAQLLSPVFGATTGFFTVRLLQQDGDGFASGIAFLGILHVGRFRFQSGQGALLLCFLSPSSGERRRLVAGSVSMMARMVLRRFKAGLRVCLLDREVPHSGMGCAGGRHAP